MAFQKSPKSSHPLIAVLDLDETLVHTVMARNAKEYNEMLKYVDNKTVFRLRGGVMTLRPHLGEFLDTLQSKFHKVIVWSAGVQEYVEEAVGIIERVTGFSPELVLSRAHCHYNYMYDKTKPLSIVGELFKFDLDGETVYPSAVLFDDRYQTFYHNPSLGILVPKFIPPVPGMWQDDTVLLDAADYIRELNGSSLSPYSIKAELEPILMSNFIRYIKRGG